MSKPQTMEELEEDLCNYCPIPKEAQGVHNYGGEPSFCVDSGCCNKAYERYLEEYEEEENE